MARQERQNQDMDKKQIKKKLNDLFTLPQHRRRHNARQGEVEELGYWGFPYFAIPFHFHSLFLSLSFRVYFVKLMSENRRQTQTEPGWVGANMEHVCPLLYGTRFDCSDNHSYLIVSLLATLLTSCASVSTAKSLSVRNVFAKQI